LGSFTLISNTTGTSNTGLGVSAGQNVTTGSSNTYVGDYAGQVATTGSNNICVGYLAGYNSNSLPLTTGSDNILIGVNVGLAAGSNTRSIVISTQGSIGKGSTTGFIDPQGGGVYQGNNASTWSTTSDRRLKKNIVNNDVGLEKIKAIQVRNFEYRLPEEVDVELKPTDAIKKAGIQLGVIAQEIQQVLPDCVTQETTGVLSVNPDNLTWYLVNAIKELSAEVASLKSQLNGA
jgi:hypothetical protein